MADELTIQQYANLNAARSSSLRVYRSVRACIKAVIWRYFRVAVHGRSRLSAGGPLIIAPVHRSNLDAPIIAAGSDRRVRSLSKRSMFSSKPAAWFISALGAFPVEREAVDREALTAARRLLDDGEAMLVFPEGTRQSGRAVGEVFDGVAYLAAKTGARVVPVAIAGSGEALPPGAKWPKRTTIVVTVGEVIDPPVPEGRRVTLSDRERFSTALRDELQRLLDEAYVLAGNGGR